MNTLVPAVCIEDNIAVQRYYHNSRPDGLGGMPLYLDRFSPYDQANLHTEDVAGRRRDLEQSEKRRHHATVLANLGCTRPDHSQSGEERAGSS